MQGLICSMKKNERENSVEQNVFWDLFMYVWVQNPYGIRFDH